MRSPFHRPHVARRLVASLLLALVLAGCQGAGADAVVRGDDARMLPRFTYDYEGKRFTFATGSLEASVDTSANTGTIVASLTVGPDAYQVRWGAFSGSEPYQSGGAARGLMLHGSTGNGSTELPAFFAYLACFGRATVTHNGEAELDPTTGQPEFGARLYVVRGHVRDARTGIIYNDVRNAAYNPERPDQAWVNATGAQAILQLRTATDQIWYHFEYETVRLEKY
jgi:hypothetical protein